MTVVLHIDASSEISQSKTRAKSAQIVKELGASTVTHRDLVTDPLPFVDEAWINARMVAADDLTDADRKSLALSDELIAELQAADTIVIGLPMYNFGVPAAFKAWMDLVARPKVTFQYEANGPVGLLTGKKAIIVPASGGVPFGSPMDHMTPHLKTFLGFLGITDVTIDAAS